MMNPHYIPAPRARLPPGWGQAISKAVRLSLIDCLPSPLPEGGGLFNRKICPCVASARGPLPQPALSVPVSGRSWLSVWGKSRKNAPQRLAREKPSLMSGESEAQDGEELESRLGPGSAASGRP